MKIHNIAIALILAPGLLQAAPASIHIINSGFGEAKFVIHLQNQKEDSITVQQGTTGVYSSKGSLIEKVTAPNGSTLNVSNFGDGVNLRWLGYDFQEESAWQQSRSAQGYMQGGPGGPGW